KTARDRAAGVRGRADAVSLRREWHGVVAGYRRGTDRDTVFCENLATFRSMHCHDHDSWNGLFSGSSGSAHAGAGAYSRGLGVFSAAALPGSAAAAGPFLHGSALGADLFRAEPRFLLVSNDLARVTAKFLCALLPHLSPPRAEQFVAPLNAYLMKYQINTVQRIAAFLGQVAVESSQFRKLVESTWYRDAKHLKATFP